MVFTAITPERLGLDRGRNVRVGEFVGNDWWLVALRELPRDLRPFAADLRDWDGGSAWVERLQARRDEAQTITIGDPQVVTREDWEYQWRARVERIDGAALPSPGVDPSFIDFVQQVFRDQQNHARWVWMPSPASKSGLFAYQAADGRLLACVAPKSACLARARV